MRVESIGKVMAQSFSLAVSGAGKDMHLMKKRMKFTFVLIALAFGACTAAEALVLGGSSPVPEIDPGLAVSAIALLGGTIAVLRVRRKKQ